MRSVKRILVINLASRDMFHHDSHRVAGWRSNLHIDSPLFRAGSASRRNQSIFPTRATEKAQSAPNQRHNVGVNNANPTTTPPAQLEAMGAIVSR